MSRKPVIVSSPRRESEEQQKQREREYARKKPIADRISQIIIDAVDDYVQSRGLWLGGCRIYDNPHDSDIFWVSDDGNSEIFFDVHSTLNDSLYVYLVREKDGTFVLEVYYKGISSPGGLIPVLQRETGMRVELL